MTALPLAAIGALARGLDGIDGTRLLDVEPYGPAFDRVEAPTAPASTDALMRGYF